MCFLRCFGSATACIIQFILLISITIVRLYFPASLGIYAFISLAFVINPAPIMREAGIISGIKIDGVNQFVKI